MADNAPQTTLAAAIRAAVDADHEASGISPNDLDAAHDTPRVAAVVAAFLQALPDFAFAVEIGGDRPLYSFHMLAEEVRNAR